MKKRIILAVVVMISLLSLSGCSNLPATGVPTIHIGADDLIVAKDLKDMTEKAPFIVVGHYIKYVTSVNAARDVQNPAEPAKDVYDEAKVYEFKVDQVLKGTITNESILIHKVYSQEIKELKDENGQPLDIHVPNSTFLKPETGIKYILFLDKYPYMENTYSGSFANYEIKFNDQDQAVLKQPEAFSPQMVKANGKEINIQMEGETNFPDDVSGKSFKELTDTIRENARSSSTS
ncbi:MULTISPECIES: hypothetical protein [Thermoactinomyces]|jgi:hypothetical protein|uniref:Lipoprotein n=1 Tax=Thermoactinomyces daqus TaxID=1329516 RepID=A0A7W2AHH1_9BACL|nr:MULTISPECIES: hypothetical protein [Thermoactinomyces]MBA4541694.1 hypothetical protein [Thermoactinomyces daqus]MBH8597694.1 hypothetical protein [Thermoactinomyces sp. CICC 10523]MBH8604034.1 hypothetical protein [Thermoactinomyces sp. CICC 10522]MBH8606431.1 hypothetical protein [Thermoactinomyces sp. CICC 10521]